MFCKLSDRRDQRKSSVSSAAGEEAKVYLSVQTLLVVVEEAEAVEFVLRRRAAGVTAPAAAFVSGLRPRRRRLRKRNKTRTFNPFSFVRSIKRWWRSVPRGLGRVRISIPSLSLPLKLKPPVSFDKPGRESTHSFFFFVRRRAGRDWIENQPLLCYRLDLDSCQRLSDLHPHLQFAACSFAPIHHLRNRRIRLRTGRLARSRSGPVGASSALTSMISRTSQWLSRASSFS